MMNNLEGDSNYKILLCKTTSPLSARCG